MTSTSEFKPIATLRGGRTKKPFKLYWNTENHHIYVERSGFFSTTKEKIGSFASSWEMAYHAAEAYIYDK